jgi:hypothetical protein
VAPPGRHVRWGRREELGAAPRRQRKRRLSLVLLLREGQVDLAVPGLVEEGGYCVVVARLARPPQVRLDHLPQPLLVGGGRSTAGTL